MRARLVPRAHAFSREAEFTTVALLGRTARVAPESEPAKQVQEEHSHREQYGWGWFWYGPREDGSVRASFVGPVTYLPEVQAETLNVYPAIAGVAGYIEADSGISIRAALKEAETADVDTRDDKRRPERVSVGAIPDEYRIE
jgi:hypothetical protein